MNWPKQAEELLLQGNYQQLATFYEEAMENDSENVDNYWYLGLAYLLLGKEEEAQTTWFFPLGFGGQEEIEIWTKNLVTILDSEAIRQETINNLHLSWLIRIYLREIEPNLINNNLQLIKLEIQLNRFLPTNLVKYNLIESLEDHQKVPDLKLLLETIEQVILWPSSDSLAFLVASIKYFNDSQQLINTIMLGALKVTYKKNQPNFSVSLANICLQIKPDNLYVINDLVGFHLYAKDYTTAFLVAQKFLEYCDTLSLKLFGFFQIIKVLISAGDWLNIPVYLKQYWDLINQFIQEDHFQLESVIEDSFLMVGFPLTYLVDDPKQTRRFQNLISKIFQENLRKNTSNLLFNNQRNSLDKNKKIKIGYLGHSFNKHCVGWLSRWLIHYHNYDEFEIVIYLINQSEDEITKTYFRSNNFSTYSLPAFSDQIAAKIYNDQIDILIDVDSLTYNISCQVMAFKPAPIQVTWLGLDASGIPAIDYFIADPYVLPENAQEYYQEQIWRLPQTYLAVDGFEVGIPTLKREDLQIPNDAIVYLSVQTDLKRNPQHIRLQLQIIKQVTNSYLLIQGSKNIEKIQELFKQIAEEEGINFNKLRFLPIYPTENYRANLAIADVVLDTYPFNGATTTMDILWMNIPVVTKVGQQWHSRQGYTLMMNAGISEGIAWNDQEYIDWGIRLGQDENLRAKIAWKLKQSRHTSPLWNAKQFTKEMENAYRQMWEIYLKSK